MTMEYVGADQIRMIFSKHKRNLRMMAWLGIFSLLFPFGVTSICRKKGEMKIYQPVTSEKYVVINQDGQTEKIDVETFLPMVLYAVLPQDYEEETMKAMIVVFRTYIYYRMTEQGEGQDVVKNEQLGLPVVSYGELEKRWGDHYEEKYNETMKWMNETKREAVYYQGACIYPYYHAVSAGTTNPGEEPYLKSVDSGWDQEADDFLQIYYFTPDHLVEQLNQMMETEITEEQTGEMIHLNVKENSEYVDSVSVGEEQIPAERFAKQFELPSLAFRLEPFAQGFKVVAKGRGCGKGLSIYGAEKMAEEGKDYRTILKYYYTGVDVHD